jgi:hypothetical protein
MIPKQHTEKHKSGKIRNLWVTRWGAKCGAGFSNPSGKHEFTTGFLVGFHYSALFCFV